ncbi:MAG: transposase [Deltaproteobacteria bacterium]|nr:transposase [Deltaproteobacteria bacterium]
MGSVSRRYIQRGKPVQNALIEAFNSRPRDECLNEQVFMSLAEGRGIIETWRRNYIWCHPHSSLRKLTPSEFAESKGTGGLSKFALAARPVLPPATGTTDPNL